jgi:16S rRNA (uracil1498-N3)-methyltransferase
MNSLTSLFCIMQLPFFYIAEYSSEKQIELDEDTSRHVVQVLRMKKGAVLNLTDGKGFLITASVTDDHKKHCIVTVDHARFSDPVARKISVAISLLKNNSRFEWFLEKVTEIGVNEIIPLICQRTEKQKFRADRMKGILVSAMLQSQQVWLPVLHDPIDYALLFRQEEIMQKAQKFIAHCIESEKRNLSDLVNESLPSQVILIGPEGDFTQEEAEQAIASHFVPVALGNTRLRAETAGIVAATLLRIV